MDIEDVIRKIKDEYLPRNIQGGKATWVVKFGDKPIAVIAQEWETPKIISGDKSFKSLFNEHGCLQLHIEYLGQNDPENIYKKHQNNV